MREAELISKIVNDGALEKALPMIREDYFVGFRDVWKYLVDYYTQFRSTPNRATLLTDIPDFPFEDTEHTLEWILDEVQQDHIGRQARTVVNELNDALEVNPREAVKIGLQQIQALLPYLGESVGERIDLRMHGLERLEYYRDRKNDPGLHGLTTGYEMLDYLTNGTQPGEIELYAARPGEGKTFQLIHGAYRAWKDQDAVVSFISPEMNAREIGTRLDSFAFNVSAHDLMRGALDEDEWSEYEAAIRQWARGEHSGFFFREAGGLGRSFTTADLSAIVRRDRPDIICIDGLLFVEPVRRDFRDTRSRLLYVVEELKQIVVTSGVPMRVAHQANRQSDITTIRRAKSLTLDELMPDTHNLAESDSTGQFANRVFTIKRIRERTYIAIRKNRNGPEDKFISFRFDADRGIIDQIQMEDRDTKLGGNDEEKQQSLPAAKKFDF